MDRTLAWIYGKLEVEKARLRSVTKPIGRKHIWTVDSFDYYTIQDRIILLKELIEDWKKKNNL